MKQRGAMEDSRWRKMLLFFILLLQFTGALSRDLYYPVRAGDDVTLSCENVIKGHRECDTAYWIYSKTGEPSVELVEFGKVRDTRSGRLSVSPNCSLVLKKVSAEDAGRFTCRHYLDGKQEKPDATVRLSLVILTQGQNQDRVTLTCSVRTDGLCRYTVKWLVKNNDVDKVNPDISVSYSPCSAGVSFRTSHFVYSSRFNLFICKVETEDNTVHRFTLSSDPSDVTTAPATAGPDQTTDSRNTKTNTQHELENLKQKHAAGWWRLLIGSVALAALIAAVVVINIWTRTEGRKSHLDENAVSQDEDEAAENYENIRTSTV